MNEARRKVKRLWCQADRLMAVLVEGGDEEEASVAVRLVVARPLSARDGEIAVMDAEGRHELAWLDSLDDLDPESRALARQILWRTYRIAIIQRVLESHVNHGHRYLKVETDRGERYFNLKEPGSNVTRLPEDRLVIRDSMGNRYEVASLRALDEESRERLERVL